MTFVPRYDFQKGTEITLFHRAKQVLDIGDSGYQVADLEDGSISVIPFDRLVEYLKLPGAKINVLQATTGDRLKQRLGGFSSAQALKNTTQRKVARFHTAMCKAVDIYVSVSREENPRFKPTVRNLNKAEARKFIAEQTALLLGEKVRLAPQCGGAGTKDWILYKGRTLYDYYKSYKELQPDEMAEDALVPLTHLRGNRTPRLCNKVRRIMTEVCEKMGTDKKKHSITNLHDYMATLIHIENEKRDINQLPQLIVPSAKTLASHHRSLLTPTEYACAVDGVSHTRKTKGRGSTDIRALMVGELCGMDEQKMSLISSAKAEGYWSKLSKAEQKEYEEVDEYIRKRLHLLILFDVASRMPLAWVITDHPNAEATMALLRMATRDKTREKERYGCINDPAGAVKIFNLRNDNGTGLRNETVTSALLGLDCMHTMTRTRTPTDRAHDERFFGTIEAKFFKIMPGYTGRRAGELPDYDAKKNGVILTEQLYGMLTRYLVDEYPFERHYGVGMFGRRPWDVYTEINDTRLMKGHLDPNQRREHLGWKVSISPSDEGVCVFRGIWFNSLELQKKREKPVFKGKVQVFVDPDNLNLATVVMPGQPEPIEVELQTTAFADLTLAEALQLVAAYRQENPSKTDMYNDRLMEARKRRYADISSIGVEHDLPRSYSTIEECKQLAKAVFSGARVCRAMPLPNSTHPDSIMDSDTGAGVLVIGESSVIDGVAEAVEPEDPSADISSDHYEADAVDLPTSDDGSAVGGRDSPPKEVRKRKSMKSARPSNLKELE